MPKLKVGDSFIYTKEMNDRKIASSRNKQDATMYIGKTVFVTKMCQYDDAYSFGSEPNTSMFSILTPIVDDLLPATKKRSEWIRNVKFTYRDITITNSEVVIGASKYTHKEFTEQYNTYRRTHNKLRSLKKQKEL